MTEAPCSEMTPAFVNVSVLFKNGMFWALDKINPSYFFSILFSMFLLCLHLILVPFCYFIYLFIIMGMFRFATWVIIFTIILLFISSWTWIRSELLAWGDGKQFGSDRYCWLLGVLDFFSYGGPFLPRFLGLRMLLRFHLYVTVRGDFWCGSLFLYMACLNLSLE